MEIGQGWARLGFGRSSTSDFYIRGAMEHDGTTGGIKVTITGGATALAAVAAGIAAITLAF